jgi:hypothetical protein
MGNCGSKKNLNVYEGMGSTSTQALRADVSIHPDLKTNPYRTSPGGLSIHPDLSSDPDMATQPDRLRTSPGLDLLTHPDLSPHPDEFLEGPVLDLVMHPDLLLKRSNLELRTRPDLPSNKLRLNPDIPLELFLKKFTSDLWIFLYPEIHAESRLQINLISVRITQELIVLSDRTYVG